MFPLKYKARVILWRCLICDVMYRSRLPGQQAAGREDGSSAREEAGPGGAARRKSGRAQTSLFTGGCEFFHTSFKLIAQTT